jgi:hypothetical protein
MLSLMEKIKALNPLCKMVNEHKRVCMEATKAITEKGHLAFAKVKGEVKHVIET